MGPRRSIVRIDEGKCNGCGQCATACAEGAIAIIDGKARLTSEIYCDGLGACLGECPQDAITIEEREAEAFDADAVEQHLHAATHEPLACGCPGSASQALHRPNLLAACDMEAAPSQLGNWPVQLMLAPPRAPYFQGARLLISADCVPFAFAEFHARLLPGRTLLIGCPKLDDAPYYRDKLAQILKDNDIQSVDVAYMEVPCCFGLVHLVGQAIEASGKTIPLHLTKIGIRGDILETRDAAAGAKR